MRNHDEVVTRNTPQSSDVTVGSGHGFGGTVKESSDRRCEVGDVWYERAGCEVWSFKTRTADGPVREIIEGLR